MVQVSEKMSNILLQFFYFIHSCINTFLENFIYLFHEDFQGVPNMVHKFFITRSASEISMMIRNRQLTCFEVTRAYVNRLDEINHVLNSVVDGPMQLNFEEAKEIDRRITNNEISDEEFKRKPLLGVPFSCKDSTAVSGRLHTLGLKARKDVRAVQDAECIRLIKEAGAILISTTNVPGFMWQETRNSLFGQSRNPYNIRRSCGASAGGEAAILSGCGSCFGIGTDSLQLSAAYCGIFGHKPSSSNTIDISGCDLRTGMEKNSMYTVGPMSRHATDLKLIFGILVGPEKSLKYKLDVKVDVKKLRYFYALDSGEWLCSKISDDMRNSILKVTSHFTQLTGKETEFYTLKGADKSSKIFRYWLTQEEVGQCDLFGHENTPHPILELAKKLVGLSDLTLGSIFHLIDSMLPCEDSKTMRMITKQMNEDLADLLRDDGILFYPSTTQSAPYHYAPYFQAYNVIYLSLIKALRLPSTQVPLGLNTEGLPLGVQVVANKEEDRLCFAVAEEIERALGGWVPPFEIRNYGKIII